MTSKPRFDPSPTLATEAGLEMAVRPLIERFVREDRRERAVQQFLPRQPKASWHELIHVIDSQRARPCLPGTLEPWNAVRGVLLVDHDAYSLTTEEAMGLYLTEDALFIAYSCTFAVIRYHSGSPLLLT